MTNKSQVMHDPLLKVHRNIVAVKGASTETLIAVHSKIVSIIGLSSAKYIRKNSPYSFGQKLLELHEHRIYSSEPIHVNLGRFVVARHNDGAFVVEGSFDEAGTEILSADATKIGQVQGVEDYRGSVTPFTVLRTQDGQKAYELFESLETVDGTHPTVTLGKIYTKQI